MCPLPHPDFQHLADYATGKLPQDAASSIAQHLTECPECESTIQALESKSDTLVSGLQVKPQAEPFVGETELRRAVANAAQLPAAGPQANPANVPPEKVSTKGPVKLGPYQLLAKLGEGGMGAVFKARHEHLDKLVAIKVLPKKAMQDPAAVARFRREMKAVGALHHPNIVGAHDAGEQQGVHFLVMEYVEGRDLSSLIKKDGPVTVEQAISYMQQAAKGLAFAHSKNIVHRDIKPANLLVDGEGTVKILDMGLARLDDGNAANAEANQGLTQTGQVMGTVDYMAPEQAFDTHRADAKADVYSLGCTLYRILTGQNAYSGDTVVQKILAHREQAIPSLLNLRADAPAALDALCKRMLAKKPEDRPTMAELAKELEALQKGAESREQEVREIAPSIVVAARSQPKLAAGLDPRSPAAAKPQANGTGRKPPLKALLAAAAASAFALIAFGVWLVVRNARDEVVAKVDAPPGTRIEVPPGGSVEVVPGPPPKPAATAAVASPPLVIANGATTTSAQPDDQDRAVAEWALGLGAKLDVITPDRPEGKYVWKVSKVEELPKTRFYITRFVVNPSSCPDPKKFGDEAVERLLSLEQLREANFYEAAVTDVGAAKLAQIPTLEYVTLCGLKGLSDDGVLPVSKLPNLQLLNVSGTAVTDRLLSVAAECPKLTQLELIGCPKITDAGLEDFKKARPDCRVIRSLKDF